MNVRFADTPADLAAILDLRREIYGDELGYDLTTRAVGDDLVTDADDETGKFLVLEDEGRIVGTLRMHWGGETTMPAAYLEKEGVRELVDALGASSVCVLTRYMVRRASRGGSGGTALMLAAFDYVARCDVEVALGVCDPQLLRLYRRLGWRAFGKTSSDGVGMFVPIVLATGDLSYLRRIGSPYLPVLEHREIDPVTLARVLALLEGGAPALAEDAQDDASAYWSETFRLVEASRTRGPGVFDQLDEADLERLAARGTLVECNRGDRVISRDQKSRCLYCVLEGTLEIVRGERVAGIASPGEILGEISFFLKTPRTADAFVASEHARVLVLHPRNVQELLDDDAALAARLLQNVVRSLCLKLYLQPSEAWQTE